MSLESFKDGESSSGNQGSEIPIFGLEIILIKNQARNDALLLVCDPKPGTLNPDYTPTTTELSLIKDKSDWLVRSLLRIHEKDPIDFLEDKEEQQKTQLLTTPIAERAQSVVEGLLKRDAKSELIHVATLDTKDIFTQRRLMNALLYLHASPNAEVLEASSDIQQVLLDKGLLFNKEKFNKLRGASLLHVAWERIRLAKRLLVHGTINKINTISIMKALDVTTKEILDDDLVNESRQIYKRLLEYDLNQEKKQQTESSIPDFETILNIRAVLRGDLQGNVTGAELFRLGRLLMEEKKRIYAGQEGNSAYIEAFSTENDRFNETIRQKTDPTILASLDTLQYSEDMTVDDFSSEFGRAWWIFLHSPQVCFLSGENPVFHAIMTKGFDVIIEAGIGTLTDEQVAVIGCINYLEHQEKHENLTEPTRLEQIDDDILLLVRRAQQRMYIQTNNSYWSSSDLPPEKEI